jgi:hypothetical protein
MIMLSQNGSFTLNILDNRATGDSKAMIDLPADLVGQPSDLFDKVFAFTFDVLGLKTVELRVREPAIPMRLDSAARTQRERRA